LAICEQLRISRKGPSYFQGAKFLRGCFSKWAGGFSIDTFSHAFARSASAGPRLTGLLTAESRRPAVVG